MHSIRSPYSYRHDVSVPPFADEGPCAIMDAQCGLCAKGARWIARNDRARQFKIIPVQSSLGSALLCHYGMSPEDPSSWLVLAEGEAFASFDAVIEAGRMLGGIWASLVILQIVPRSLRNWLYGLVARNRYRFFGRTDLCSLPDPEVQRRLLR